MKKSIIIILVLIMVLQTTFVQFTVSALDGISQEEAESLVVSSYKFFIDTHIRFYTPYYNLVRMNEIYSDETSSFLGYLIPDPSVLPGGSFDGMAVVARSIYTEELADESYLYSYNSSIGFREELFYIGSDGAIYHRDDFSTWDPYYKIVPLPKSFINFCKDVESGDAVEYMYAPENVNLKITKNGADKAIAELLMYAPFFPDEEPLTATVEYKKTSDGWRISGGTYYLAVTDYYNAELISLYDTDLFFEGAVGDIEIAYDEFVKKQGESYTPPFVLDKHAIYDLDPKFKSVIPENIHYPSWGIAIRTSANMKKCTFDVYMFKNEGDTYKPVVLTAIFEPCIGSDIGWILSGGSFYDYVNGKNNINYRDLTSPATGDEDVTRAAVFSVS
ncbi:MAG: hypothetical protein MJ102_01520, partial [Clostridia bacterium]|nr:hypothetical protein [Clostridia bacterium]